MNRLIGALGVCCIALVSRADAGECDDTEKMVKIIEPVTGATVHPGQAVTFRFQLDPRLPPDGDIKVAISCAFQEGNLVETISGSLKGVIVMATNPQCVGPVVFLPVYRKEDVGVWVGRRITLSNEPPSEIDAAAVPDTLEESFAALDRLLVDQRDLFKKQTEQQAVRDSLMGLGLFIRNEWFRSGESSLPSMLEAAGARSLEDMSSMVVASYWRHLNKKPVALEKQGACYERLWAERQRLKREAHKKGEDEYDEPTIICP